MKLIIKVPATSANLGPGFDALGLALDLWNETTITPAAEFSVAVQGEGADKLTSSKNNLIVRSVQKLAERVGKPLLPFHAECINRIPLSSGMGSSSAAILTGLLAGNALWSSPFTREEILNFAVAMEGHPDNVAPAMLGGLVVSTMDAGKVIAHQTPVEMDVHVTIALPDFHLPTKQARAVLPKKVSMKNAVHNISRAMLVVEAFRIGDLNLLGKAMTDKLHQPYRIPLIPGVQGAMDAMKQAGASAVALSGAGPSLIAFSSKREAMIGEAAQRVFAEAGLSSRVYRLKISRRGVEVQVA